MKTALRSCATVVFASITLGQSSPKDVDGWGKIKWGMTAEEVRAVYGLEDRLRINERCGAITIGCWDALILKAVKIGDISMDAQAQAMHGSERITRVRLWLHFGLPDDAPSAGPRDFDTLKTQLIQKYGSPVSEEMKREYGDPLKTVLWAFPSTSILLKLSQKVSMPNLGSITLEYTGTDKKALDVL